MYPSSNINKLDPDQATSRNAKMADISDIDEIVFEEEYRKARAKTKLLEPVRKAKAEVERYELPSTGRRSFVDNLSQAHDDLKAEHENGNEKYNARKTQYFATRQKVKKGAGFQLKTKWKQLDLLKSYYSTLVTYPLLALEHVADLTNNPSTDYTWDRNHSPTLQEALNTSDALTTVLEITSGF